MSKPRVSEMIAEMLAAGYRLEFVPSEFIEVAELHVSAEDDRSWGDAVHVYILSGPKTQAVASAVARAWASEPPDRRD